MSSGTVIDACSLPTRASSAMAGRPLRTVIVSDARLAARSTPIGYWTRPVMVDPMVPIWSMPTRSAKSGKSRP